MKNTIKNIGTKKIIIGTILVIVVLVLFFNIVEKKENNIDENLVYQNTINISRTYGALRLKTDKVLTQAKTYPDYNTWNEEMTELINNWKNLEEKASDLEKQADFGDEEKVSFGLVNVAQAYTKDEISNVFDKARAGKKIRTLAKYLGVDAKRAFKILKTDQDFVKADAWNKAGDELQTLESSATVIKDGCKVGVFVGALVLSGGTAGAAVGGAGAVSSAGGALITTVVGTDLILEVSGDAATIALGENDKTTKYISKIRSDSYMEPAAAVLSLSGVPDASKVDLVIMQAEALRSALQDKKILGIEIPKPTEKTTTKIKVSALEKTDLKDWAKDHEVDTEKEEDSISEDLKNEEDAMVESEEDDWREEDEILEDWLDGFAEDMGLEDIDELEEWLDDFENLDDWLEESEEKDALEEEEKEAKEAKTDKKSSKKLVDKYKKEMQGKSMEDY